MSEATLERSESAESWSSDLESSCSREGRAFVLVLPMVDGWLLDLVSGGGGREGGEDRVVVRMMGGEERDRDMGEGEVGGVVVVRTAGGV